MSPSTLLQALKPCEKDCPTQVFTSFKVEDTLPLLELILDQVSVKVPVSSLKLLRMKVKKRPEVDQLLEIGQDLEREMVRKMEREREVEAESVIIEDVDTDRSLSPRTIKKVNVDANEDANVVGVVKRKKPLLMMGQEK
jgi:hypothetical protein